MAKKTNIEDYPFIIRFKTLYSATALSNSLLKY